MSLLQLAADTLIDRLRAEVLEQTVLIATDDLHEVKRTPSLLLQGPKLQEHDERRSMDLLVSKDLEALTFEAERSPRFYHADFEVVLTCARQEELFSFQQKFMTFMQRTPWLIINESVKFALQEVTPLGGLNKPNLSNLRQAAGVYRIEDVPVFDGQVIEGKLCKTVVTEFRDAESGELISEREVTAEDVES